MMTRTLYWGRCEKSSVELVTPSVGASALALLTAGRAACTPLAGREDAPWAPVSLSARRPLTLLGAANSSLLPPPACSGSPYPLYEYGYVCVILHFDSLTVACWLRE